MPTPSERFFADLRCALGREPVGLMALAVSGGGDSMAMLSLAAAALPGRVIAATVDHALRDGSSTEAAMVARACAARGVQHATLRPDAPIAGASLQAQARHARYGLLCRWVGDIGAECLITAHHADDQAETLLMRAARGSGIAGLAGIRARVAIDGVTIVRPLLGWRRAELRAIAAAAGPFVDDPANADGRHDRTRFRRLLEANDWLDPVAVARSAAQLGEADADWRAVVDWLWAACRVAAPEGEVMIDVATLPRELRRRLARRAIETVRRSAEGTQPAWSNGANVEELLDALAVGKTVTQAGVLAIATGGVWHFRTAPPRRAH